jgi:polysaccharide biosynthesis transport protein
MAADPTTEIARWGSSMPLDPLIRREQDPFSSSVDFKEYWRMISKHRLALISLAFAAAVMVIVWRVVRTPQYEATSTLLIQPQSPQVLPDAQNFNNGQFDSSSDYDYYRTQFELLKSASLAASVIRSNGLEANPLFNPALQHPGLIESAVSYVTDGLSHLRQELASLAGVKNDNSSTAAETDSVDPRIINAYLARLTVLPVRNTRLVIVGFTTPDPELSARIANAHVRTFIHQGLELQAQTGHDVEEFLSQKLSQLKDNVEQSEAALNAYRRKVGIVTLESGEQNSTGSGTSPLTQRLAELNTQLTDASSKRIVLGTQHQMIMQGDYASLPEVISNPVIQSLKEQVAQLSAQYAALSNRFNPGYHPLDDLQARLIASHRALEFETKRVADSVNADYQAALANEGKISQEITNVKSQMLAVNDASLQEAVLEREVDANRQLYRNVLERMNEISVASEVPASNVSVVDSAHAPISASGARLILLLAFSVSAAALVGVALVLFVESIDDGLRNGDDVARYLGLPNLGTIPDFEKLNSRNTWPYLPSRRRRQRSLANPDHLPGQHRELLVSHGVFSTAAEVYRAVRSAIMFSRAGGAPKSMLVTSSTTSEGKTITAVNIATAFAHTGGRTLLIDTDFRRSRCPEILAVESVRGLSDVLVRQSTLAETIFETQVPGLSFIGIGMRPPNPSELLGSLEMRTLIRQLSKDYDYLILDSAPLIPVSDSVGLSTMVEAVLLVADCNTSRRLVREACLRLNHVGAPMLGVVLNRVDDFRDSYYRDNYYSDYYSFPSLTDGQVRSDSVNGASSGSI